MINHKITQVLDQAVTVLEVTIPDADVLNVDHINMLRQLRSVEDTSTVLLLLSRIVRDSSERHSTQQERKQP